MCISANYRLRPQTIFPGHQIDAKKVIAWVREHGSEYRGRPLTTVRGRQFRRIEHGGPLRTHAERPLVPARSSSRRHVGHRGDLPLRLLRTLLREPPDEPAPCPAASRDTYTPVRHRSSSPMAPRTCAAPSSARSFVAQLRRA
ncbi:hypothetical protein [Streptomyces sp. KL116D]|uniref:hypothetical protein n=1 Tax=Streptomyces sp. KL116D TaxID=3045152 RepID=UPI003557CEF1